MQYPIFLAPMYRGASADHRAHCHEAGACLSYFVMLARAHAADDASSQTQAPPPQVFPEIDGIPQPQMKTAVQLIGSDPQVMAREASLLEAAYGNSICAIEINMGCPMVHVTKLGAGAVLMEDVALAQAIIEAVVEAVSLPVSVKFRKGPSEAAGETAPEFARMAEAAGASLLTVHGRFTSQHFEGLADKAVVERVKSSVGVPVYASGDVCTVTDVTTYRNLGADGVMVARAARENPGVFADLLAGAS